MSTTKAFFAAMKSGDAATGERAFHPTMQENVKKRGTGIAGLFAGLEKEAGKVLSISHEALFPKGGEGGDSCKVPVTFHYQENGTHVHEVDLTKVNGEWLITSF